MTRKRLLFTGVGGQGVLLASRLLGEAAMTEGMPVRVSEVHGMAQRGGVVESTVMLGGLESPIISDNEADVLVSLEPLEALRALHRCSIGTVIITNTIPITPFTVKLGQAEYPDISTWMNFIARSFKKVYAFDAQNLAREAGTTRAVNVVLLGALIATGIVPIPPEKIRKTIQKHVKSRHVDSNLKAFELGLKEVMTHDP